jgi:hypothetical protein
VRDVVPADPRNVRHLDALQEVLSAQTLLEIMLLYGYNNIHGVPVKFAALIWRTVKPAHALDA